MKRKHREIIRLLQENNKENTTIASTSTNTVQHNSTLQQNNTFQQNKVEKEKI